MFYFNFCDESWKSNSAIGGLPPGDDDNWGLYYEGDETGIGARKW